MQNTNSVALATEVYSALSALRSSDTIEAARHVLRVLQRREMDIRNVILTDAQIDDVLDICAATYNRNQNLADALI